jgi:SAM-dependent methyltransferase
MPLEGRPGIVCPRCGSHERHRAIWILLSERLPAADGEVALLHLAPEPSVQARLRTLPNVRYLAGDLDSPHADVQLDIAAMPFPDASFDAVICSHVLEHVDDDRAALAELRRVLRPGAWVLLSVPVDPAREETFEDPAIVTPEARTWHYWQHDHVRLYCRDFLGRVAAAGFEIEDDAFLRRLPDALVERHGINRLDTIVIARRPYA